MSEEPKKSRGHNPNKYNLLPLPPSVQLYFIFVDYQCGQERNLINLNKS